jgi:hypothetical protein
VRIKPQRLRELQELDDADAMLPLLDIADPLLTAAMWRQAAPTGQMGSAREQRKQDEKAVMPSWSPTSFVIVGETISAQGRKQSISEPDDPSSPSGPTDS